MRILFRLDPEKAHHLTTCLIKIGIFFGKIPLRISSGSFNFLPSKTTPIEVSGLFFKNRLGLAAGFDKNAEILQGLPALGFGFAEIGTVTFRPQPGNPRPRLFRIPSEKKLFNRMGFNNLGATLVAKNLERAKKKLPEYFPVGVNLGKNKDTPLEEAAQDYIRTASVFHGLADYLVINVSSPNTPGLRSLQSLEALKPILDGVNDVILNWGKKPPLFLKIAPEIQGLELAHLVQGAESCGIDGWVLTNTLQGEYNSQPGGWSGSPLTDLSRRSLIEVRQISKKTIISVGGILSSDEAQVRIREGADLVQVYTGWIYEGPSFPKELGCRLD